MRNNQSAVYLFRDRFNALPGDFPRAFQTWGSLAGCTNNDVNSVSSGCNGNGNGIIGPSVSEAARVWQHLAAAGMVNGSYDGASLASAPFVNSIKASNTIWVLYSDSAVIYNIPAGTYNLLAAASSLGNGTQGFISSAYAYAVDSKIDDAKPATGFLRSLDESGTRGCAVLADGVTSVSHSYSGAASGVFYRPSSTTAACTRMYFYIFDVPS